MKITNRQAELILQTINSSIDMLDKALNNFEDGFTDLEELANEKKELIATYNSIYNSTYDSSGEFKN